MQPGASPSSISTPSVQPLERAGRVYLKRRKDPDKADARHNEVKEELESVKCYSFEFRGRLCSDSANQ